METSSNLTSSFKLQKIQKIQACQSFLPSLAWSMVLLGVFMFMGSLIMGNLLQVCLAGSENWGMAGFKDFFFFTPDPWGDDPNFD